MVERIRLHDKRRTQRRVRPDELNEFHGGGAGAPIEEWAPWQQQKMGKESALVCVIKLEGQRWG